MQKLSRKSVSWLGLILGTLLMFGCSSSSSNPAAPAAGSASINLNGGNANPATAGSYGGSGGSATIESYGTLTLSNTGTVNTIFTVPPITIDYGTDRYTVVGDETVALDPVTDIVGLYVLTGDFILYLGDGSGNYVPVTGLYVPQGTSLTLPKNDGNIFYAEVDNDIVIDGTLTTLDESVAIDLRAYGNLLIGSTGVITTKPATPGADGGDIYLYADLVAVNQGLIDGSGSEGDDTVTGGYGISVKLEADGGLYNTGKIHCDGGSNVDGDAGIAGNVYLYSYNNGLYSSGTITANGGSATNGDGGDGGYVELYLNSFDSENMQISGLLHANGGDAINGNGGSAFDYIDMIHTADVGSQLLIDAELSARGGDSTGNNFSGGDAYSVYIYSDFGSIHTTGSVDLSGGDGDLNGGAGGWFEVYAYGGDLELVGYDGMTLNGGEGETAGNGGNVYAYTYFVDGPLPAGAITNGIDIAANGGAGSLYGGDGGYFDIKIYTPAEDTTFVTNSGALSADGGNGATTGGDGGTMYITSPADGAESVNTGTLSVAAGIGAADGSDGTTTVDWWGVI